MISLELRAVAWYETRRALKRPWPESAALIDIQISGAAGDGLGVPMLAARWGWRPKRVARLLSAKPRNEAPNRAPE